MRTGKVNTSHSINKILEFELSNFSKLYSDNNKVNTFLKHENENKTIPNYKHKYVFILIISVLKFNIPVKPFFTKKSDIKQNVYKEYLLN
jgi:hypothetical protein